MSWTTTSSDACADQYQRGFNDGLSEGMVLAGTLLAAFSFLTVVGTAVVYKQIREIIRPWALDHVKKGEKYVLLLQRDKHPLLTKLHQFLGFFCGVEFYITFLPFLFWVGEMKLARTLTLFMAVGIYSGNAIKDVVCSPRPSSPPVEHIGLVEREEHAEEYGFASTHTINTLCLAVYMLHHYAEDLTDLHFQIATALVVLWVGTVMYGRLYLGMHSPVDVVAGVVIGMSLFVFWVAIDDYVDAWITRGTNVPPFQILMSVVLVLAYPVPLQRNPSFSYAVYFSGVVSGVVIGVHRTYTLYHSPEARMVTIALRDHYFTVHGYLGWVLWIGRRFLLGMVIVLVGREIGKQTARTLLWRFCAVLGIPVADHDAAYEQWKKEHGGAAAPKEKEEEDASPRNSPRSNAVMDDPLIKGTYNVNTAVRLISFSVVGWAVVEPCFYAFEYLQI